jgi:hypothetical protein
MKWSDTYISFRPDDHPETELFNWNLPFVIKLLIGQHKVDKTMVDNGASLNLIMSKTFIEMGLNLAQGQILGNNKHREMLTFEVTSFDIGYNCILGRPFFLKFMVIIHTAYATMKMPSPKGIITTNADQRDALACENASLSHAWFVSDKIA